MNKIEDNNTPNLLFNRPVVKITFFSCFTALALTMDMRMPNLSRVQQASALGEIIWNFARSIESHSILGSVLWVLLYVGYSINRKANKYDIIFLPVNLFISSIWLLSEGFRIDNTVRFLFASPGQVLKSFIYIVGVTYGLTELTQLFWKLLGRDISVEEISFHRGWIKSCLFFLKKHVFLSTFLILMILWLPHIIISFPAYVCYDAWEQLAQYYGLRPFSAHHPPIMTLIMGSFVQFGRLLLNANLGLFLFIVFQTVCVATIEAYLFVLFRDLRTPTWIRIISLLMCVFVPYYTDYIGVLIKDNLYSYMILLFHIELVYLVKNEKLFFEKWQHPVLWFVSVIGTLLFRNNGAYVIYPFFVVIFAILIKRRIDRKKQNKVVSARNERLMLMMLFLPIILASAVTTYTTHHYKIEKGSIREALSLPMQQTARYVKTHDGEVTEEEREAISAVLDYELLAEVYDPKFSDPVKIHFKYSPTREELLHYFCVWAKQFTKHPETYCAATLNQNYYLFYPFVALDKVYTKMHTSFSQEEDLCEMLDIYECNRLLSAKDIMAGYYYLCFRIPGISILSHPSTYVILLMWMLVIAAVGKDGRFLFMSLPSVFSLVVNILAPSVIVHPRYFFPIVFVSPLLLGFLSNDLLEK